HFLEAKTFRLRVRFLSLFSRRLVIKEVALIDPNVVWPQDAEGKWKLPRSKAIKSAAPRASRPNTRNQLLQNAGAQRPPVVAISPPGPAPAIQSNANTPS